MVALEFTIEIDRTRCKPPAYAAFSERCGIKLDSERLNKNFYGQWQKILQCCPVSSVVVVTVPETQSSDGSGSCVVCRAGEMRRAKLNLHPRASNSASIRCHPHTHTPVERVTPPVIGSPGRQFYLADEIADCTPLSVTVITVSVGTSFAFAYRGQKRFVAAAITATNFDLFGDLGQRRMIKLRH